MSIVRLEVAVLDPDQSCRHHDNVLQLFERAVQGGAPNPERQQENPNDGVEHDHQQCERPTEYK